MSFESGKKYGYIASMINVILPVIVIILYLFLFIYQLGSPSTSRVGASMFPAGLSLAMSASIAVIGLIGLILFMLSMYNLSKYYSESVIFRNILYAFVLNIIVSTIAWIVVAIYISSLISQIPQGAFTTSSTSAIASLIIAFLIFIVIAFAFLIITAVLYWRAFNKLGEKSGIENFKTAGLLYLIGSVLCIIAIGYILIWITWIYAAKAYKQLTPQPYVAPPTNFNAPQTGPSKIFCSYCGTQNDADAAFCKNCGKSLRDGIAST
jgi:uncharacterized membrane protein